MAESARNLSLLNTGSKLFPDVETALGSPESGRISSETAIGILEEFLRTLPCVIYECSASGEVIFVSENITDLLGFERKELVGRTSLWGKCIFPQDLELFRKKMNDLDQANEVKLVHRLVTRSGLPVWVNHGVQKVTRNGNCVLRGCFLEIGESLTELESGQSAVERFVHKLGNHFTLLHVVLGSLRRVLPASRETDVLHETVDRAIELTRSFSQYSQKPSCWLESVEMIQLLEEALLRVKPAFAEKGVFLQSHLDDSMKLGCVAGDPFVLEVAVGHILQNALEATTPGGKVTVEAWIETHRAARAMVYVRIRDTGVGIEEESLGQLWTPFFSTKEGHEGLGLNMAQRFVEMHKGFLSLASELGKGTEVTITLPANSIAP
jgi:PAS domain S-box-containing protein